jgi:uncharacterized protein YeaO (DUF488 family)
MNTSLLSIKRIYEEASPDDGLRVLVDRLWPRGVSKEVAALDFWAKEAAPSETLRKWFDHRPERFAEFKRRYEEELDSSPALVELRTFVAGSTTTLLFAAKDLKINHAVGLAEVLTRR